MNRFMLFIDTLNTLNSFALLKFRIEIYILDISESAEL